MKLYTLILTTCLTLPLFALENAKKNKADPFKQALTEAFQTNPDLSAAQAEYRSQVENEPIAISRFMPKIDTQMNYGNTTMRDSKGNLINTNSMSQPYNPYNALTWTINAKYNIFSGLADLANLNKTQYNIMSAAAKLNNTESTVLNKAITAYMDYLTKQEILKANVANEQSLQAVFNAETTKFQVGENTKFQLLQAQAQYEASKAARIKAEGDVEVSRATYQQVIGSAPEKLNLPSLPKNKLPKSLEEAIALTLEKNPSVIQARFLEKAAHEGWAGTIGAFLPQVDLNSSFSVNDQQEDISSAPPLSLTDRPRSQTYALTASWNLFNGLANAAQFNQGVEQIQVAKAQLEAARRTGIQAVTASWRQLIAARDSIIAQKAAVVFNTEALEAMRQGERLGTQTLLNVLDTESRLLKAQQDLAGAIQDEVVNTFGILNATGSLSAHELELDDPIKKEEK